MSGKKHIEDGQEVFDGIPVDFYEGRFSGVFDLEDEDGVGISSGDVVSFLVTTSVSNPKFSHNRRGDFKRSNTFKVVTAYPIDRDEAKYLLDNMEKLVMGINDGPEETEPTGLEQPILSNADDWVEDDWNSLEH